MDRLNIVQKYLILCFKTEELNPRKAKVIYNNNPRSVPRPWLSVAWDDPVQSCAYIKTTDLKLLAPALQEISLWAMQNTILKKYLSGKSSEVT